MAKVGRPNAGRSRKDLLYHGNLRVRTGRAPREGLCAFCPSCLRGDGLVLDVEVFVLSTRRMDTPIDVIMCRECASYVARSLNALLREQEDDHAHPQPQPHPASAPPADQAPPGPPGPPAPTPHQPDTPLPGDRAHRALDKRAIHQSSFGL